MVRYLKVPAPFRLSGIVPVTMALLYIFTIRKITILKWDGKKKRRSKKSYVVSGEVEECIILVIN